MQDLTGGIDRENKRETYGTGRSDKEIYRCMLRSAPRISKINVHSSLRLSKLDDIRGYNATDCERMDVSVSYSTIACATELPVILHNATELLLHRLYRRPTLGYGKDHAY